MNRKKHTNLKKTSVLTSVLLTFAVLFGCATNTTPPASIPPPPAKTESVVPQLAKVTEGVETALKANARLESKIEAQKKEITDQQIAISEAVTQAEKLKEALKNPDSKVTAIDFLPYIETLKQVQTRNLFIEKQNSELTTLTKEQEAVLKMTKEDASKTYQKLIAKESEADSLRAQNNFLGTNLQTKNLEVEQLKKDLTKEKVKASKASVYRNWVIGLAVGFILWTIIKNILMIYFPVAKFRI